MSKWKCKVCGYIYEGASLPEDFVCPVCRQPASAFEKLEEAKSGGKYAGTQTEKNLKAAFSGESEARNKYTYFSSVAKKEGYEQIAALFLKTAENEREHAKMWFKELNGIGNTEENLLHAAEGENYEWTDMYEGFAQTAEMCIRDRQSDFCCHPCINTSTLKIKTADLLEVFLPAVGHVPVFVDLPEEPV